MAKEIDYSKVCFVIMPFGVKELIVPKTKKFLGVSWTREKKIKVDFDYIYDEIFMPAISEVNLPEGGKLIPKRADKEFYTGSISKTMFELIEYSRMALADISGINGNVLYELGARHDSSSSGTAIFRLSGTSIPFDIKDMRSFPYKYNPFEEVKKSKELVTKILQNSVSNNTIDSPIYLALQKQKNNKGIQSLLLDIENALRQGNINNALKLYNELIKKDPGNINALMKRGILYKNNGEWLNALNDFTCITNLSKNYFEAYREKGIAENKLYEKNKEKYSEDGIKSLEEAIKLQDKDYDSYCSLGGALKRKGNLKKAMDMYKKAIKLSLGNPYPLLNYIKIKCKYDGRYDLDESLKYRVRISKEYLENQIEGDIPFNVPWSFFDLSEIYSIIGVDAEKIIKTLKKGIKYSIDKWQIRTFRDSIKLLEGIENIPDGYKDILNYLNSFLKKIK